MRIITTYKNKNMIRDFSVGTYLRTLRYLRLKQILYLLSARIKSIWPSKTYTPHIKFRFISLKAFPVKPVSYLGGGSFRFLNHRADLGSPIDWRAVNQSMLWRYNLHYFDYLLQTGMNRESGLALMESWHQANPGGLSPAWDPYPTSLRIVNWLKFASVHGALPNTLIHSLGQQTLNLTNRVEYHLSGNHLWANGKALWISGAFLGRSSTEELGRRVIFKELEEQILPDGGHYELSPMYHAIVLEDLLDLINLEEARKNNIPSRLKSAASKTRAWLEALMDDQGRIPLLNDATFENDNNQELLPDYADALGVAPELGNILCGHICNWEWRNLSGYFILTAPGWRVIFDTAPLGPSHQLGHAHCDMLSILLTYKGKEIFTDTGVFEYQEGKRRTWCRSTAAHNTVMLDGLEQAEMWKSFRVGRRGCVLGPWRNEVSVAASHTGFTQQKPGLSHTRILIPMSDGIIIADQVRGLGNHRFRAFFHLSPEINLKPYREGWIVDNRLLLWPVGAEARLTQSEYYSHFGEHQQRPCLILEGKFSGKAEFKMICTSFF